MSHNRNEKPWWDERVTVSRPDVPSELNTATLGMYRTDEEREEGGTKVQLFVEEIKAAAREDPDFAKWLGEVDTVGPLPPAEYPE